MNYPLIENNSAIISVKTKCSTMISLYSIERDMACICVSRSQVLTSPA